MLWGFLAGRQNIIIEYGLAPDRIVEVTDDVPSAGSRHRQVIRSANLSRSRLPPGFHTLRAAS